MSLDVRGSTRRSPSPAAAAGRSSRRFSLQWLLDPIHPDEFVAHQWEKRPLFISRSDSRYFANMPGLDDVDELITATSSHSSATITDVRIIKTDQDDVLAERRPQALPSGVPDIQAIYREYQRGCSVAVNHLHRRSAAVAALCGSLEEDLQHPVGANLYLSPRDAQGFRPHADTHDVFVLQLHGAKDWYVSGPSEALPLPSMKHGGGASAAEFRQETLRPGDVLYLPRGFEHYAMTRGTSSLHLTVRVEVFRWLDLMTEALHELARGHAVFRRALPPGSFHEPVDAAQVRILTETLAARMQDPTFIEVARGRLATRLLGRGKAATVSQFGSLDAVSDLTLRSTVARARGHFCRVSHTDDSATIEFPGNFVSGPAFIAEALRFVAEHDEFAVQDLPGDLSPTDKVDLVVRMVNDGLLRITATTKEAKA
jgi:bifunctional lysine-specific demethylase and histidyl-hydroxylase NO66